jgi:hypothetical protein
MVSKALQEVPPVADTILSLPALLVSVGARGGASAYAVGAGENRKMAAQTGQAAADYVMEHNPLSVQKLMQKMGYGKDYDATNVAQALQKVSGAIERGGEQIEKSTGGRILKEDVQGIVDTLMAGLGTEGTASAARALKARRALNGSLERPAGREQPTASLLKPQEKAPGTEQPTAGQPPAFEDETQLASWLSSEGTKQATKPRMKGPAATMRPMEEPFQHGTVGEARGLYDPSVPPLPGTVDASALKAEAEARTPDVSNVATPEELTALKQRLEAIHRAKGERGSVDIDTVAKLAAVTGGAALGSYLSDDKLQGAFEGLAAGGLMGHIKESGGFWHPATVARISEPLDRYGGRNPKYEQHTSRMVNNYLNKYAATARDPLKDIEIPARQLGQDTVTWGEAWDKAVDAKHAGSFKYRVPKEMMGKKYFEERQTFPDIPQDSVVWHYGSAHRDAIGAQRAIHDYLAHVADYMATVPEEKLKNYDLVRAVKETAEADKRAAAAMDKEAAKATAQLPTVKEYPDGYKWVEIKEPEELTPEQMKGVGKIPGGLRMSWDNGPHIPHDSEGKPIFNRFRGREVGGEQTPERAWLSGRLTEEGNALGHCVGGYCEGVAAGESRIFSLRDEKGRSHVTVEVKPDTGKTGGGATKRFKDDGDITQIRGKQNRAPEEKYVPYVQDLIRSGKWGKVYELDNARLLQGDHIDMHNAGTGKKLDPEDIGLSSDKYYTENEVAEAIQKASKDMPIAANYRRIQQQRGAVDVRLLKNLAAASLGVAAGAYLDPQDPLTGAVLGAGAALAAVNGRAVVNSLKNMSKDTRIRIDHLPDAWEGMIKDGALNVYRVQQEMNRLAPKGDFAKITKYLEGDKSVVLTTQEAQAARLMLNVLIATQKAGLSAGVMSNSLENYMKRIWLDGKALRAYMNAPKAGSTLYQGMRQTNKAPTIAEGKAAGLKPVSEDARHLLGVYVNSVIRSIAAKQLVDSLKAFRDPAGEAVVRPAKGAPMGWQRINSPHLMGSVVHPDIAPSIRFVLDNADPSMIMRGLEGINLVIKRLNVSFSLFHAKALLDAYIGAGGDVTNLPGIAAGTDRFLQGLKKLDPNTEKYIQLSRKNGLEFSLEGVASDDVRTTKAGFRSIQNWMDTAIPGMGSLGRAVEHINALSDRFMWERLHAGMKLNIFTREFDRLQKSNAAAHAKNPSVALMAEDEIAKIASSYTNDLFGGLNWRRVAESIQNRFGRDLALEAFKPANRRIMQLLIFAPDWTISTFRAAAGSLAGGLKGTPLSRMHRMYMLRSAIYYTAIAEAINYPLSGHHIWQNNDPTRIDLGNGQTMQWSKHFTEPFHWGTMPVQQGLNKLGILPKAAANFALGTEYLSSQGHSPKAQGGRFSRLARQALPISVAQQFEAGPGAGISGFFGVPIYGKSTQQREQEKLRNRLERQINPSPQQIQKRVGKISTPYDDLRASDTPGRPGTYTNEMQRRSMLVDRKMALEAKISSVQSRLDPDEIKRYSARELPEKRKRRVEF